MCLQHKTRANEKSEKNVNHLAAINMEHTPQ